jgi:nucleoside-diphosphate-sugar epimerase/SAM-dependent methyltransferase
MKKKKIVITGGLGYLGSEICKLYSGEAWYHDITVIDSKFSSALISQLRNWGINFVQADLSNHEALEKTLDQANIVIHLAGITNVAYTKTESNEKLDNEIYRVGVLGTRNIIKYTPPSAKIIFPSTHVVFEGLTETKLNIGEDELPKPVLTYAKGKVQSEVDLANSDRDYVIIRLASVYGDSGEATRINIMPNLFASKASQNGTIRLYSGGVQMKSLVPVFDVARCFKFMAEESSISREIFHCSKESMPVKEVAELCKKFAPDLNLTLTDDEIPNLGYTISNKKLLSNGFKFLHNVEDSIADMIKNWSRKESIPDLEYKVKSHDHYNDKRGQIGNYELTEPINLIGHITSKTGTIRANHYHPIQEQKCLLVKGQYISVIKDLSKNDSHIETQVVNEGDLSVIKPNVAHTMVFTKDSIFLNLVRGNRDHDKYGITHTIPYLLVEPKMSVELIESVVTACRSCSSKNLKRVISLGESPLANNLLSEPDDNYKKYPLEMDYCEDCHNCQLSCVVDPKEMFDNYLYVSSTSKQFIRHFEKAAHTYKKLLNLNENSTLVDIGSNDGVALKPMKELGVRVVGVEPAGNLAKSANTKGLHTINAYFNDVVATQIHDEFGEVDLVTASNVFAHSDNLEEITKNVFVILKKGGTFIIEVQYLVDTISSLTFDNIYHEHVNFWSVKSLNTFFNNLGFFINRVEHIDTHGGSIRVYIQSVASPDSTLDDFLDNEKEIGVDTIGFYKDFSAKIESIKKNVRTNLDLLKKKHSLIAGYGAPAKATTALNYFGINGSDIGYIIEDNELKHDKYIPGVKIPIKSKSYCRANMPELVIVLAWNFFDSIIEQNQDLINSGVTFINISDLYENHKV